MNNCQDGRFNCGPTLPSACVPYTGLPLQNIDLNSLSCKPNINDIIQGLDSAISTINSSINLSQIISSGITLPTPLLVNTLFQTILDQLTLVKSQLASLQTEVDSINLLNEQFNIDLSCIFGGSNCNPTNQYTLLYILNVLVQQICNLKAQINQ